MASDLTFSNHSDPGPRTSPEGRFLITGAGSEMLSAETGQGTL